MIYSAIINKWKTDKVKGIKINAATQQGGIAEM
jgi:hypothetical protein